MEVESYLYVLLLVYKMTKRFFSAMTPRRVKDDRPGIILRLPVDLREAITEESRIKGDLARIFLFALAHVDKEDIEIRQTRKAGLPLTKPQLLHVGSAARVALKKWAEEEGVSVNAIVVSVLDVFFKQLRKVRHSERSYGWKFGRRGGSCRIS